MEEDRRYELALLDTFYVQTFMQNMKVAKVWDAGFYPALVQDDTKGISRGLLDALPFTDVQVESPYCSGEDYDIYATMFVSLGTDNPCWGTVPPTTTTELDDGFVTTNLVKGGYQDTIIRDLVHHATDGKKAYGVYVGSLRERKSCMLASGATDVPGDVLLDLVHRAYSVLLPDSIILFEIVSKTSTRRITLSVSAPGYLKYSGDGFPYGEITPQGGV